MPPFPAIATSSHTASAGLVHTNTMVTRLSSRGLQGPAATPAAHDTLAPRAPYAAHLDKAFRPAASLTATPSPPSATHYPRQDPGSGHTALKDYMIILMVVGIVVVLTGLVHCGLRVASRKRRRRMPGKSTVEVVTATTLSATYTPRPTRDMERCHGGVDLEAQGGQELQSLPRYQRPESEGLVGGKPMDNAGGCNDSCRTDGQGASGHVVGNRSYELCRRCAGHQRGEDGCPGRGVRASYPPMRSTPGCAGQAVVKKNRMYMNLDRVVVSRGSIDQRRGEVVAVPPPAYGSERGGL